MSEPIRVLLVDDEPLARARLRRLLDALDDAAVVGEAGDGASAVTAAVRERPDLLFLDVQMPGLDGFGVVRALAESLPDDGMPLVVFVTAYDEHALRAFEAQALDYLVKPFEDERFAALMERVRKRVRQARVEAAGERLRELLGQGSSAPPTAGATPTASVEQASGQLDRLVLRLANRARIVRTESVDWIGADGVYSRIHFERTSYLLRMPMHELETRLDPRRFVRIHRSTIVNIDRVKEVHEIERGEYAVVLEDGTRLKLSRSRRAHFESMLGQSL